MNTESSTSATTRIHFRDRRPPEEIQFQLERELAVLFRPVQAGDQAAFRGMAKVGHVPYYFTLVFEAALPRTNCYRLEISASWADLPAEHHAGFLEDTRRWFAYYTRDFKPAAPPEPGEGSGERYKALVQRWMTAEAHLDSVPAVQQAILKAMRAGWVFSGATKEGNWIIQYGFGRFHGDKPYRDEKAFLEWLRGYFDVRTSAAIWPDTVPDFDAWKIMLRLLEPGNGLDVALSAARDWLSRMWG